MRKLLIPSLLVFAMGIVLASCGKTLPTQFGDRSSDAGAMHMSLGDCELSLGNRVWMDANGNGIQDDGEPGMADVSVKILNPHTKEIVAMTKTDADGYYWFRGLCAGEYEVQAWVEHCVLTKSFAGAPDVDSNMNPALVKLDQSDDTIDFGFICKPDPPKEECKPCDGKVTELTMAYRGDLSDAHVVVTTGKASKAKSTKAKSKKAKSKKSGQILFDGIVGHGNEFSFVGLDDRGTMGTNILVYVNGEVAASIHTSCSKPIGPGMTFGDFEIIAGRSLDGGVLCPVNQPPPPDGRGDLCEDFGRPAALEMLYTGAGCGATHHSQDPSKVSCNDSGALPEVARIVASDSATPGSGRVWFDGFVQRGGTFTLDAANAGQSRMSTNTYLHIYDGQVLIQQVQFHTSCSQPLLAGDAFGSAELVRFVR